MAAEANTTTEKPEDGGPSEGLPKEVQAVLANLPDHLHGAFKTALNENAAAEAARQKQAEEARLQQEAADEKQKTEEDQKARLDELTNTELMNLVVTQMQKALTAGLEPLQKQVSDLSNSAARDRLNGQISEAKKDPMLEAFAKEVTDLNQEVGGALPVKDLLALAKARNPDKVAELNASMERKKRERDIASFGGLLPTDEGGRGLALPKDGPVNLDNLLEAIYDRTLGSDAQLTNLGD